MTSKIIDKITNENRKERVKFNIGDSIVVHVKIKEGDKERIQLFHGQVIAKKGHGPTETFTVRRIAHGVGVERVFQMHSPGIEKIEVEAKSQARRAKLYFLRGLSSKETRQKTE